MSYLRTRRRQDLWPIWQPATRWWSRRFSFTFGSCHVVHLYKQSRFYTKSMILPVGLILIAVVLFSWMQQGKREGGDHLILKPFWPFQSFWRPNFYSHTNTLLRIKTWDSVKPSSSWLLWKSRHRAHGKKMDCALLLLMSLCLLLLPLFFFLEVDPDVNRLCVCVNKSLVETNTSR